jgi:hypothetical protein
VWRPCWISGGYRLKAASRPIALYIVGIREAQGRNQHFESGTGTWSSDFWLAMADCLGRFGRASHSTSRYHTPPRSWDKSKCMFNAKPESQALLPLLCSSASILQDNISSLIAEPLRSHRMPSALVRRMSQDMTPYESSCKPYIWRHSPLSCRGSSAAQVVDVGKPSALEAWQTHHLASPSKSSPA